MVKRAIKKITGPLFLAVGLVLLVLLIRKFGFANLLKVYEHLGLNLIYILLVPFLGFVFHTFGWYWAIEETGSHVSFPQLLKIKLGGESVNTLTPVSFMGGDPIRILLLTRTMPGALSTASVVLDRTMQSLAIVVLLLCGLTVAWIDLELPHAWKILFPAITLALILLLWFLIHRQQKGIFESLVNLFHRLGFKSDRISRLKEHIEVVDHRIADFYRHNKRRFAAVLVCHVGGRFVGVGEIYLIARLLKIPIGFEGALYLASLTVLINIVFVFIPGSMGVLEGAFGALCHLLNLNPLSGVAIQLVRRLRAIFWVFVGLILMGTLKQRGNEPNVKTLEKNRAFSP